ncbi:MAG: hypothetical protein RLW61_13020 [Gammaproteobacteria bacterium]
MKDAANVSDIPVDALHASSIRAMSEFVRNPSPQLAETIVRLLDHLAAHPARFVAPCGHDVYAHARAVWHALAEQMRCPCAAKRTTPASVH